MAKKVAPSAAAISQQDKEHLKSLFAEFLSHKEYRELEHGCMMKGEMMITLCAAYGKFDFSVVLEHFSDLMSALKFHGTPKEFMSWDEFVIHYAAYYLLDCPLLDRMVGASNDFRFMEDELKDLLFLSYYYGKETRKAVLKPVKLPDALQFAVDQDDPSVLLGTLGEGTQAEKQIADVAYTALLKEKWTNFAALLAKYDLVKTANMEKVFELWSKGILSNAMHTLESNETFDFPGQWQEPGKYPLHRMMIEYARERSVPALWRQGFLTPEIIEYLWNRGISFDAPLTPLYGWEKVSVAAFAACFGDLADRIELIPLPKHPSRGDLVFRQNVKSAAFFNEFAAKHPRKAPEVQKAPAVKKSKGELTDEQKARLANDEAAEIVFSKNKKTLVQYATCLGEREEWIQSGYPVPDFVTTIGVEAFAKVEGIEVKKVILPEGLVKIGRRAFEYCEIETVVFPSTLKTIEDEAFQFCSLKELHLLEGTEHIGTDAFCNCRELQSAYLPDSLTGMGTHIFRNCDNLTEIRLPATLKTIPQSIFAGCKKLEKIFIPDSVEKIEDFAFQCCPELCTVEVPEGIEVCGNAFQDSPKVKIVYRPLQKKQVK